MATHRRILLDFLLVIFITGCFGSGGRGRKDRDHKEEGWAWGAMAGVAVIIAISIAGAALFSLAAWLTCSLYTRCRRDRVGDVSLVKVGSRSSAPPSWSTQLVFRPELAAGFGLISEGFTRLGPAQLVRSRPGLDHTDGAKWSMPMSKGKHVFEIIWPWGHRGNHAAVGLATEDAPLKCRGTVPLVGSNGHSWGLDIVKRKVIHANKAAMTCPTDGSYVPDKFLMYVDIDEGTLGFGNDVTYWGEVIENLPTNGRQPLYLMVAASKWQSELTVVYRGSAPADGDEINALGRPHHLPPLYNVDLQEPPSYSYVDNNGTGKMATGPVMVQPLAPPTEGREMDPPPPYSRPPSGYSVRSDKI